MADNIYTKGTRVWLTDKEQGWISAEVTQVSKGDNDAIRLVFVDERGKVWPLPPAQLQRPLIMFSGIIHRYYGEGHQGWEGRSTATAKSASTGNCRRPCNVITFERTFRQVIF